MERKMARRPRRNHSGEFEARAALAALAPLEALYPDGAYVAAQPRKQAA
jgi:hypothetical protein